MTTKKDAKGPDTIQVIATRSFDNITQGERFRTEVTERIKALLESGYLRELTGEADNPVDLSYAHIAMSEPASTTYPVYTPGATSQFGESDETRAMMGIDSAEVVSTPEVTIAEPEKAKDGKSGKA